MDAIRLENETCGYGNRAFRKSVSVFSIFTLLLLGLFLCSGTLRADADSDAPKVDIETLKAKAEQGDPDAQCDLGVSYEEGEDVPKDEEEAVKWYRKAAEQGFARGQLYLGINFEYGIGVPEDKEEAVKWYRKAAEQGDARGQFNLGVCYEHGNGVPEDKTEAAKWYRKAAEQGDARGQRNLGVCYEYGNGVPEDKEEAVKWYRKAAEQGDAGGQFNLGRCFLLGIGVNTDEDEGLHWITLVADNDHTPDNLNIRAVKSLAEYYYSDGIATLIQKALGASSNYNNSSLSVENFTRKNIYAQFANDDYSSGKRESDFELAAKYLEKLLQFPAENFEEKEYARYQGRLSLCYLAQNTIFVKQQPEKLADEKVAKPFLEKYFTALKLASAAAEKEDPTGYFSKILVLSMMIALFPDQENELIREHERAQAQLKRLADSGNNEAKVTYGRLVRFTMAAAGDEVYDELGAKYIFGDD